jgi:hypothetical protein
MQTIKKLGMWRLPGHPSETVLVRPVDKKQAPDICRYIPAAANELDLSPYITTKSLTKSITDPDKNGVEQTQEDSRISVGTHDLF